MLDGAKFICFNEKGEQSHIRRAKGRTFTIGYLLQNDYVLGEDQAEPIHCIIECDAFGHVTIHNKSEKNPVQVNGEVLIIKRTLFNNSKITILGKEYQWQYKESSSNIEGTSTPTQQICKPVQAPNSCPNLKYHRQIAPRFTMHSLRSYRVDSDENNVSNCSIIEEGEPKSKSEENIAIVDVTCPTAGEELLDTTPAKVDVVDSTPDKKTLSTEKRLNSFRNVWGWSGMTSTSYSPRETGVRTEKTFTALIPPKTPNSRVCRTPKGLLERLGVEKTDNVSTDLIVFATPVKQPKNKDGTIIQHANSAMKIVDLTTPSKLRPASPAPKFLSTKKPTSVKVLKSFTDKSLTAGSTTISNTPSILIESETPTSTSSTSSVITVDSSSATSDISEVSMVTSTTPLRAPTSHTTPAAAALRKQVLLASAHKQNTTPARTIDIGGPGNCTPNTSKRTVTNAASTMRNATAVTTPAACKNNTENKNSITKSATNATASLTKKSNVVRKLNISTATLSKVDSSINIDEINHNVSEMAVKKSAHSLLTTSTPYKLLTTEKADSTEPKEETEFFSALHSSNEDEQMEENTTKTAGKDVIKDNDELLKEIEEILHTSDELKKQLQHTEVEDSVPAAEVVESNDIVEPLSPPSVANTATAELKLSPKSSVSASILLKAINSVEMNKSRTQKEDDEKENKINECLTTPIARRRISLSTTTTSESVTVSATTSTLVEDVSVSTPLTPKRITKRRLSVDEVPIGNITQRTIDHFNTENMGAIVEEEDEETKSSNEQLETENLESITNKPIETAVSNSTTTTTSTDTKNTSTEAEVPMENDVALDVTVVKDAIIDEESNTSSLQCLDESFAEPTALTNEEINIETEEYLQEKIQKIEEKSVNIEQTKNEHTETESALELDESFGEVEYLDESEILTEDEPDLEAKQEKTLNQTFEVKNSQSTSETIEEESTPNKSSLPKCINDDSEILEKSLNISQNETINIADLYPLIEKPKTDEVDKAEQVKEIDDMLNDFEDKKSTAQDIIFKDSEQPENSVISDEVDKVEQVKEIDDTLNDFKDKKSIAQDPIFKDSEKQENSVVADEVEVAQESKLNGLTNVVDISRKSIVAVKNNESSIPIEAEVTETELPKSNEKSEENENSDTPNVPLIKETIPCSISIKEITESESFLQNLDVTEIVSESNINQTQPFLANLEVTQLVDEDDKLLQEVELSTKKVDLPLETVADITLENLEVSQLMENNTAIQIIDAAQPIVKVLKPQTFLENLDVTQLVNEDLDACKPGSNFQNIDFVAQPFLESLEVTQLVNEKHAIPDKIEPIETDDLGLIDTTSQEQSLLESLDLTELVAESNAYSRSINQPILDLDNMSSPNLDSEAQEFLENLEVTQLVTEKHVDQSSSRISRLRPEMESEYREDDFSTDIQPCLEKIEITQLIEKELIEDTEDIVNESETETLESSLDVCPVLNALEVTELVAENNLKSDESYDDRKIEMQTSMEEAQLVSQESVEIKETQLPISSVPIIPEPESHDNENKEETTELTRVVVEEITVPKIIEHSVEKCAEIVTTTVKEDVEFSENDSKTSTEYSENTNMGTAQILDTLKDSTEESILQETHDLESEMVEELASDVNELNESKSDTKDVSTAEAHEKLPEIEEISKPESESSVTEVIATNSTEIKADASSDKIVNLANEDNNQIEENLISGSELLEVSDQKHALEPKELEDIKAPNNAETKIGASVEKVHEKHTELEKSDSSEVLEHEDQAEPSEEVEVKSQNTPEIKVDASSENKLEDVNQIEEVLISDSELSEVSDQQLVLEPKKADDIKAPNNAKNEGDASVEKVLEKHNELENSDSSEVLEHEKDTEFEKSDFSEVLEQEDLSEVEEVESQITVETKADAYSKTKLEDVTQIEKVAISDSEPSELSDQECTVELKKAEDIKAPNNAETEGDASMEKVLEKHNELEKSDPSEVLEREKDTELEKPKPETSNDLEQEDQCEPNEVVEVKEQSTQEFKEDASKNKLEDVTQIEEVVLSDSELSEVSNRECTVELKKSEDIKEKNSPETKIDASLEKINEKITEVEIPESEASNVLEQENESEPNAAEEGNTSNNTETKEDASSKECLDLSNEDLNQSEEDIFSDTEPTEVFEQQDKLETEELNRQCIPQTKENNSSEETYKNPTEIEQTSKSESDQDRETEVVDEVKEVKAQNNTETKEDVVTEETSDLDTDKSSVVEEVSKSSTTSTEISKVQEEAAISDKSSETKEASKFALVSAEASETKLILESEESVELSEEPKENILSSPDTNTKLNENKEVSISDPESLKGKTEVIELEDNSNENNVEPEVTKGETSIATDKVIDLPSTIEEIVSETLEKTDDTTPESKLSVSESDVSKIAEKTANVAPSKEHETELPENEKTESKTKQSIVPVQQSLFSTPTQEDNKIEKSSETVHQLEKTIEDLEKDEKLESSLNTSEEGKLQKEVKENEDESTEATLVSINVEVSQKPKTEEIDLTQDNDTHANTEEIGMEKPHDEPPKNTSEEPKEVAPVKASKRMAKQPKNVRSKKVKVVAEISEHTEPINLDEDKLEQTTTTSQVDKSEELGSNLLTKIEESQAPSEENPEIKMTTQEKSVDSKNEVTSDIVTSEVELSSDAIVETKPKEKVIELDESEIKKEETTHTADAESNTRSLRGLRRRAAIAPKYDETSDTESDRHASSRRRRNPKATPKKHNLTLDEVNVSSVSKTPVRRTRKKKLIDEENEKDGTLNLEQQEQQSILEESMTMPKKGIRRSTHQEMENVEEEQILEEHQAVEKKTTTKRRVGKSKKAEHEDVEELVNEKIETTDEEVKPTTSKRVAKQSVKIQIDEESQISTDHQLIESELISQTTNKRRPRQPRAKAVQEAENEENVTMDTEKNIPPTIEPSHEDTKSSTKTTARKGRNQKTKVEELHHEEMTEPNHDEDEVQKGSTRKGRGKKIPIIENVDPHETSVAHTEIVAIKTAPKRRGAVQQETVEEEPKIEESVPAKRTRRLNSQLVETVVAQADLSTTKKPRGRRAKNVEIMDEVPKIDEEKSSTTTTHETHEEPSVPVVEEIKKPSGRGRRAKVVETPAPSAHEEPTTIADNEEEHETTTLKETKKTKARGGRGKATENVAAAMEQVEATTSTSNEMSSEKEISGAEVAKKTTARGRRGKTAVENTDATTTAKTSNKRGVKNAKDTLIVENVTDADIQTISSDVPAVTKKPRGRAAKNDTASHDEVANEEHVTVEKKPRARRQKQPAAAVVIPENIEDDNESAKQEVRSQRRKHVHFDEPTTVNEAIELIESADDANIATSVAADSDVTTETLAAPKRRRRR